MIVARSMHLRPPARRLLELELLPPQARVAEKVLEAEIMRVARQNDAAVRAQDRGPFGGDVSTNGPRNRSSTDLDAPGDNRQLHDLVAAGDELEHVVARSRRDGPPR